MPLHSQKQVYVEQRGDADCEVAYHDEPAEHSEPRVTEVACRRVSSSAEQIGRTLPGGGMSEGANSRVELFSFQSNIAWRYPCEN